MALGSRILVGGARATLFGSSPSTIMATAIAGGSWRGARWATSSRITDEQLKEISKYDTVMAEQMRTARDRGLPIAWRDLGALPTHGAYPDQRQQLEQYQRGIAEAQQRAKIAASASAGSESRSKSTFFERMRE